MVFCALEFFLAASCKTSSSLNPGAQFAPGALLVAILITFQLTCLLLFAYVGAGVGGAVHGGFLAVAMRRLAAVTALLAVAVLHDFSTK
uniref:Uncharacterized protein n=1 Tax=Leersia perrieri TaxID=77586 RepID=A0A0D9WMZ5_9ORYZ